MAEQKQQEKAEDKMNPEGPTIYDEWKPADGLFKAENVAKRITFVSRKNDSWGFVRVVGGNEGYTRSEEKTFDVPAGHKCEVLGCKIMFTRA